MQPKEKSIGRMYWSIGEVADELGLNPSLLRYWEKEFGSLRPKRTNKGGRLYTKQDIDQLREIRHLVKEKGFTLQGAKHQLRKSNAAGPGAQVPMEELREKLLAIRRGLVELLA